MSTPQRSFFRKRPPLGLSAASNPDLGMSYNASNQSGSQSTMGTSTPGERAAAGGRVAGLAREAVARKASLNQLVGNSYTEGGHADYNNSGSSGRYGLASVRDDSDGAGDDQQQYSSPANSTPRAGFGASRGPGSRMAPTTPGNKTAGGPDGGDIEVGDSVDVPGGMHGTVKFIGSVKGKPGVFAGVELSREFAARGKNDGDVDGTRYFTTSIPNSGIFLPLNRAAKRASPTLSSGSFPPTPSTPSFAAFNLGNPSDKNGASSNKTNTPPTPSVPRFSQSVGPGRAPSPQFKPRASRPSIPRPESPSRKLATPVGRPSLGAPASSRNGGPGGRYAPSPTPGKFGAGPRERRSSAAGDPGKRFAYPSRPGARTPGAGSRAASALSMRSDYDEGDADTTPVGTARTYNPGNDQVEKLKKELAQRDKQLREQTSSLTEMEKSFAELQNLLPADGIRAARSNNSNRGSGSQQETDISQLRTLLREKNEKISMLTAEFDAHRADFRSTIDTLEMASTETERVYEKRIEDLLQEVRDLQDRGEDVESVARQLKQLEELVQELEEGLEDARRGEAEARGEVEFLRGEVERGRSELRREREKAAAALKGAGAAFDGGSMSPGGATEVEQRDDEIRGLKAIIHSLSRDAVPDMGSPNADGTPRSKSQRQNSFTNNKGANGTSKRSSMQLAEERIVRENLEREVKELQGLVERKAFKEEELERELERLRRNSNNSTGNGARATTPGSGAPTRRDSDNFFSPRSERTMTPSRRSSARDSKGTVVSWRDREGRDRSPSAFRGHGQPLATMPESEHASSVSDGPGAAAAGGGLWCEICETSGHDILTCTQMFGNQAPPPQPSKPVHSSPVQSHAKTNSASDGHYDASTLSPHSSDQIAPLTPGRRSPAPPTPGTAATGSPPSQAHATSPVAARMPNPMDAGMVAGKSSGVIDPNRWCALCERDGHESVDCPFEDAF
ncbi:MAG: Vacuolar ATP synthase subunit C [Chaenotheca gracillima]|nr:MAG: Vacuolar ATP synthase subunit C [Chaenotheca gracillima]